MAACQSRAASAHSVCRINCICALHTWTYNHSKCSNCASGRQLLRVEWSVCLLVVLKYLLHSTQNEYRSTFSQSVICLRVYLPRGINRLAPFSLSSIFLSLICPIHDSLSSIITFTVFLSLHFPICTFNNIILFLPSPFQLTLQFHHMTHLLSMPPAC